MKIDYEYFLVFFLFLDVHRETVRRILKENKIKPFKPTKVQRISEEDKIYRMSYCEWATAKLNEDIDKITTCFILL